MKTKPRDREEEATDVSALERHVLAVLEGDPAVREALALLAASKVDVSGSSYGKKIRALREPALAAFKLGGGARLVEAEIARLTHEHAAVSGRLERTVEPVLRGALQAQEESLSRDLADKSAVLAAAGAPVPDHAAELAGIAREIDESDVIIRRHRAAGLAVPADLQERVVVLRERFLEVEAAEKTRRSAFDDASAQAARLTQEALHALGTTVSDLARRRFDAIVALLRKDLRRAEVFPDEADPAIARDYGEFMAVCDLAGRLGRSGRVIEDTSWRELAEREAATLRRVLKLGRGERTSRRRGTVQDAMAALGDESRLGAA